MKRAPIDKRFWERVAAVLPRSPGTEGSVCMEWQGAITSEGYGHLSVDGRNVKAHRFAFEATFGPIPAGLFVCHTCDNRKCVNPIHLFLGTNQENMADAQAKGRRAPIFRGVNRGEAHGRAKLSEADVRVIRASGASQRTLAAQYGVSKTQIGSIRRRERWDHVEG